MKADKFEYIYYQYRNLVMDAAYDVLKDYHLAQDVCQDVFIKLTSERIEQLQTPNEIKCYLRTVAYHRAIDYYRKMKRHCEISLEADMNLVFETDMDSLIDREGFTNVLFSELAEKHPQWHEIVIRLGLYDEAPEIVARDLGISIGTLRTKYHRAKKWICKYYKEEYHYLK